MSQAHILAAIRPDAAETYRAFLLTQSDLAIQVVTDKQAMAGVLTQAASPVDILIIDNELGSVFEIVRELRQSYPRLLIILVDEDADFSLPGRADDVSTDPFTQGDLLKRIRKLLQERQTETLRADSLPPVREVAKKLREASGARGKAQATAEAISQSGYDLVVFYQLTGPGTPLTLVASVGPPAITSVVPDEQKDSTLASWVSQNGQSRIVGPADSPNFSLVKRGRLGAGACVPVGSSTRYGVLLACREIPESITQEEVLMLELICTQLASALAKETNR